MNSLDLIKKFLDIRNAVEITAAVIETVSNDNSLKNDRLEWLLAGALEQVEKIKQATESIDGVMREKENCAS